MTKTIKPDESMPLYCQRCKRKDKLRMIVGSDKWICWGCWDQYERMVKEFLGIEGESGGKRTI